MTGQADLLSVVHQHRAAAIQSKAVIATTGSVPTDWSYVEVEPAERPIPSSAVNLTGLRNLRNPTSKFKQPK